MPRLETSMTLCDPPKDSDTEPDNRRHSVPIKIHMENKVDIFKLNDLRLYYIFKKNLTKFTYKFYCKIL